MNKAIGQRIKQLREHYSENQLRADGTTVKFTQTDLAAVMNVGQKQISRWENGEVSFTPDQLVKLSEFFHVSVDYLLRGGEIENLEFMNQTGLSAKTIELLKHEQTLDRVHFEQQAIDFLALHPAALFAIYLYLTDNFTKIETPDHTFFPDDMERISRLSVLDELAALRAKIRQ